jgi:hypothetical protein
VAESLGRDRAVVRITRESPVLNGPHAARRMAGPRRAPHAADLGRMSQCRGMEAIYERPSGYDLEHEGDEEDVAS